MKFIDSPTARTLPSRPGKPCAVVLHTTGSTDLPKILKFYQSDDGLQPHYVISTDGTVYRIAPESSVAWHCKIDPAEARFYRMGYQEWSSWLWNGGDPKHVGQEDPRYVEWRDRWQPLGKQSPLDLVTGDHPNYKSVGIELQQPTAPTKDIFTDAQYASLVELLLDVGERNSIPVEREHVLGHYDCSPMTRSNASGGWDPGRIPWNRIWDAVGLRG